MQFIGHEKIETRNIIWNETALVFWKLVTDSIKRINAVGKS